MTEFLKHITACNTAIRAAFQLLLGCLLCLFALPAAAHEIRPAIVDVHLLADGKYQLSVQVNMESVLAGVSPTHSDTSESPNAESYNGLCALPARELEARIRAFWPQYREGLRVEFEAMRALTARDLELSLPDHLAGPLGIFILPDRPEVEVARPADCPV